MFGYKQKALGTQEVKKAIKPKNSDYKAAKLKIIFEMKYLPTLRRHEEIRRLLDWNCTNWWWNWRDIIFLKLPKFYYRPIGQQVRHAGFALFFYWWLEKPAWCQFRVIWQNWRNHNFTHSLTVNNLLSSFLFSPTPKKLNFLLFLFSIFEIILSHILTWPQNAHHGINSKSNYDLAANPQ